MNTVQRFWAFCLDMHMKLTLYKDAIIITIIIVIVVDIDFDIILSLLLLLLSTHFGCS